MRPIFCGNFDYDARQSDLERLFRRYGKVERVDMKSGFAFVYMDDERDADDAIRALDRREFGRKGRPLRVEWTRQDRGIRRPEISKRSANTRPSKTLFVINFDAYNTQTRDLERHFDPYGKIVSVRIRKNFAFVQFELQEDATRALKATDMSKLSDRVISVEYAVRDDDDDKRNRYSPHDRPLEGGRGRGRSPSPYRKERGSPDYGRRRSPSPYRRDRASPDYGRRRNPSPYRRERGSPVYSRGTSPDNRRIASHSPYKNERAGSDLGRASSPGPHRRERLSLDPRIRSRSPYRKENVSPAPDHRRERSGSYYGRDQSISPDGRKRGSRENEREQSISPDGRKRTSPDLDDVPNGIPYKKETNSPNNEVEASPDLQSGQADSPIEDDNKSPVHERYRSRSPSMGEKSQSD